MPALLTALLAALLIALLAALLAALRAALAFSALLQKFPLRFAAIAFGFSWTTARSRRGLGLGRLHWLRKGLRREFASKRAAKG